MNNSARRDFYIFIIKRKRLLAPKISHMTGAIVGPIGEIVCIYFGVWQYTNPTFIGILYGYLLHGD